MSRCPHKEIKALQFGLGYEELFRKYAVTNITYVETYKDNYPVPGGLCDPKMGSTERWAKCFTCGKKMSHCPGHFGFLKLVKAVYHPGYLKDVLYILRCVCRCCSRLLIKREDIKERSYSWIQNRTHDRKHYSICGKEIKEDEEIEDGDDRIGCGTKQYKFTQAVDDISIVASYSVCGEDGKIELKKKLITAEKALMILQKISVEDAYLMGFDSKYVKPPYFILTSLGVPPPAVRPSIMIDSRHGVDDLTTKLSNITKYNNILGNLIERGADASDLKDTYHSLQYHVATYMNNAIPRIPQDQHRSGRPLKTLSQRLKDKDGRVRQNLSGKRVNFSSRDVITGDANIDIDELGIPLEIAMHLTWPYHINRSNIEEGYRFLRNGPHKYPGANYLLKRMRNDQFARYDLKQVRDPLKMVLKPGDILEIHLRNGDLVLNNRQPTLHKPSMMGHKIRVFEKGRSFRLSAVVTTPYNADFDGDEMNIHIPQTQETVAELMVLSMVSKNLIAPKNSNAIIGLVQDPLLAIHLLTQPNVFFTRQEFYNKLVTLRSWDGLVPPSATTFDNSRSWNQGLNYLYNWEGMVPPPAIITRKRSTDGFYKVEELWTGRQLVSIVMPSINFGEWNAKDSQELNHKKIYIRDGELLCGTFTKKQMGPSSGSIVQIIRYDYDEMVATEFLNSIKRIANDFMLHRGFSIGFGDCVIETASGGGKFQTHIQNIINSTESEIESYIEESKKDKTKTTAKIEHEVNRRSNSARKQMSDYVYANIDRKNSLLQMVSAGSKGNENNISQIAACVGQQNVMGKRIRFGFYKRTLPHYFYDDYGLESRGFVKHCYTDGLEPEEYFFHAQGGREGLSDTSVKTATVGYLDRKLMKALEDVGVHYDGTVRNSLGNIVQFRYGDDGIDPCQLEKQTIIHATLSDEKFEYKYRHTTGEYAFAVENEWKLLSNDRKFVQKLHTLADGLCSNLKPILNMGHIYLPFNLDRWVLNTIQKFKCNRRRRDWSLHPSLVIRKVDVFLRGLKSLQQKQIIKLQPKCGKLLGIAVRSKLSSKRVIHEYHLSEPALDWLLVQLRKKYIKSMVQPGEMVGALAAQSIGEPTQQLTLNSVDWTERFMVYRGKQNVFIGPIGQFIDNLISKYPESVLHLPDEQEYLDIKHLNYQVPTADENGKSSFETLEAVTRHLPGGQLVHVTTRCGRSVKATQGESFLVRKDNKLVPKRGDELKIGDFIPVLEIYPILSDDKVLHFIDMEMYFPKDKYIWSDEMLKAKEWKKGFAPNQRWFKKGIEQNKFTVPFKRSDTLGVSLESQQYESGTINTSNNLSAKFPSKFKLDWLSGFFFGAYLAEGNATNKFQVSISNNDPDYRDFIKKFCDRHGFGFHVVVQNDKNFKGATTTDFIIHAALLRRFIVSACDNGSHKKHIPSWSLVANKEFNRGLLNAYFSGDGGINMKDPSIRSSSSSKELTIGIGHLLSRFNITPCFRKTLLKSNNIGSKNIKPAYVNVIRNDYVKQFAKEIGFVVKEKSTQPIQFKFGRKFG